MSSKKESKLSDDLDPISRAIGTATGVFNKSQRDMEARMEAINDIEDDRDFARANMREAIVNASMMLPGLIALANTAQSPNVYNSASQFMKTFAELNESLIGLNSKGLPPPGTPELQGLPDETGIGPDVSGTPGFKGSTEDFLEFCMKQMQGKTEKAEVIENETK